MDFGFKVDAKSTKIPKKNVIFVGIGAAYVLRACFSYVRLSFLDIFVLLAQAPTCFSTRKIRYETHVAPSCEEGDRDGQGICKPYQNTI